MELYPRAAVERAMKVQEVILRALAKKITWLQAAEIIGITDRQMRRLRQRFEEFGYDGLVDRRRGRPSQKRIAVGVVEQVLAAPGRDLDHVFSLQQSRVSITYGPHLIGTYNAQGISHNKKAAPSYGKDTLNNSAHKHTPTQCSGLGHDRHCLSG